MIIISAIKSANHEAIPFIARLNQVLILYGRQHPVHRYSQSYTIDWLFSFTSVQTSCTLISIAYADLDLLRCPITLAV